MGGSCFFWKRGRTRPDWTWSQKGGAIQVTFYCFSLFLDHPNLEPRHFVDEKVVNENHKDFMFLECILFITEVRTGRFVPQGSSLDIRYLALAVVFSSSFARLLSWNRVDEPLLHGWGALLELREQGCWAESVVKLDGLWIAAEGSCNEQRNNLGSSLGSVSGNLDGEGWCLQVCKEDEVGAAKPLGLPR